MKKILRPLFIIVALVSLSQADQIIPPGNEGPPYFYPANPDDRLYKLPWAAGDTFAIDDHWGYPSDPNHIWGANNGHLDYAIDISFPPMYPIRAARAGKVLSILKGDSVCNPQGLGNFIKIFHPDSMPDTTRANGWRNILCMDYYYHIHYNVPVKVGEVIKQGQIIAYTWCSAMPVGGEHLHFEVQIQGHKGSFAQNPGYTFESIPVAFYEIRQNSNGLPDEGYPYVSQNIYNQNPIERGRSVETRRFSAYPNPFKNRIEFAFKGSSLEIFDMTGKRVATLVGAGMAVWNGAQYPAGIYFVRLIRPEGIQIKQVLLVK